VKFYPGLNRDLILAGIFLHDIAKTWELCYDCAFGYTDGGQLVGHIVKSAIWVEHKAREAEALLGGEKIPQELVDVLQHIILSHHGEVSDGFGSAKSPATPEAIAVHYIENLDAKLMMSLGACRGTAAPSAGDGNWTEYMKAFGGRLYRPDVAPADAPMLSPEPVELQPATMQTAPVASPPDQAVATTSDSAFPRLVINNPLFDAAPAKRK
jgi:3'-5' exoribonuclease